MSSVSGGSVIAAYFALYGAQGLERFEPAFLAPDNMRTLGLDAANPITWLTLAVTGSPRTDVVEKLFDDQLFGGQTFAALNRPGKPYLILNATDMASGEVFAFTPNRFDDICSDLDKEPISVGVAASSAVPVVLSPIALRDYSAEHCKDRPAEVLFEILNEPAPKFTHETWDRYYREALAVIRRTNPNRVTRSWHKTPALGLATVAWMASALPTRGARNA